MTQTRRMSLTESVTSTAIGFVISLAATYAILPAFGYTVTNASAFGITAIYTAISIVRGYVVRRAFNR